MMKWKVMKGTEVGMKIVQNEGGNVAKRKEGRKKEGRKEGKKQGRRKEERKERKKGGGN